METSGTFRFKSHSFAYAPESFQVMQKRRLAAFPLYGRTDAVQELGWEPVVVTGTGTLTGADMMEQYEALYGLFLERSSGLLTLPGRTPFWCYFETLELTGKAGPRVLEFRFRFREDASKQSSPMRAVHQVYRAKQGDTLLSIAAQYGILPETLRELNPQLAGLMELTEGTSLWLG